MGDRALVIFVSSDTDMKGKTTYDVTPTAYLHWGGSDVPKLLQELKLLMETRSNDESYSLARFIGICHAKDPDSCYSLGCFETPSYVRRAIQAIYSGKDVFIRTPVLGYEGRTPKTIYVQTNPAGAIATYSHGDAGVVVVDTGDFSWKAYGGYLQEEDSESE